jgi:acyl carrier protein
MTLTEVIHIVKSQIVKETGLDISEIEDTSDFYSLGLDSVNAIFVLDELEKKLKVEMNPMFFWDFPTVEKFSGHIHELLNQKSTA